ncbi:Gfo/Idh/MocA family oxidoreductase [Pasteurellaceae bacterium LIM206]|nr:Gfo/Idh/MocA family oxidoreductase [Pasteurellaceae bacterium LIM206]
MNDVIKIAVIGCGFFGQQLAAAFHKAGANVIAVTDINPTLSAQLALQYQAQAFDSSDKLFQCCTVDLAVIATPNYAHYSPAVTALQANCHLFVETPFALNHSHCQYILQTAREKEKQVFIGHLLRTLPGIQKVKQLLDENHLGKITVVRAARQRWIDTVQNKEWWKFDSNLTGGELFHEIHELDLLCWLLGDIHQVYAQSANLAHPETPDNNDITQLLFSFKNGILGSLEMGTAYRLRDWGIVIHGEKGAITINLFTSTITVSFANGHHQQYNLYNEFEADLSLRENAKGIQKYNTTQGLCPYWLTRAVEIEAENIIEHLLGKTNSPLVDYPTQAIAAAQAAKHSMIAEKRIEIKH